MRNPIFLPSQLHHALSNLPTGAYNFSSDNPGYPINIAIAKFLADTSSQEGSSTLSKYRDRLLDWAFHLNHYFSGPDISQHPNAETYKLHWAWNQNREFENTELPDAVKEVLREPNPNSPTSQNASYTQVSPSDCLIWVDKDATIEELLDNLKEWNRISCLVASQYEDEPTEGELDIWGYMGLSGDDDVDYASSYLDEVITFFQVYLYLHTQDERFLTILNQQENSAI